MKEARQIASSVGKIERIALCLLLIYSDISCVGRATNGSARSQGNVCVIPG